MSMTITIVKEHLFHNYETGMNVTDYFENPYETLWDISGDRLHHLSYNELKEIDCIVKQWREK